MFYNDNGVKKDYIQILNDHRINSVRPHTWVDLSINPALKNKWIDESDT
ncbi:MAG: glycosyl hydrolase 53 family protein [Parabacteroides sp.]|nr:glycosyl hydrolase 53 family protein [Parabacteroides sp.]MBP8761007.1 glycosyl hydrolase 53 family protein [Parabacteroides sp.]MDD3358276.1 glycosyl hydrolase 53 family protein [Parabacteroides sp.]